MNSMIDKAGLKVSATWPTLRPRFTGENRQPPATRDDLQARVDAWHDSHPAPIDSAAYQAFLRDIGYPVAEPARRA